jgi:signal transduction histidine kinase
MKKAKREKTQSLFHSRELLWKEICGFTPDAVALSDETGRIRSHTKATPPLLEDGERLEGRRCVDLVYPIPETCLTCPVGRRAVESPSLEVTDPWTKGRARSLKMVCQPLQGGGNAHLLYDLSSPRLWRARQRLVERLDQIKEAVSFAIHEINNYLTSISGYSQLLLGGEPKQRGHFAKTINTAVLSTREILSRTQALVSPVNPRQTWRQVNILQAIDEACVTAGPEMKRLGVALKPNLDPGEKLHVWGDPVLLKQCFLNLALNAAQAAHLHGEPPRVEVSTSRTGDLVLVEFRDNGPGVPPEMQETIFQTFFTTKKDREGHGLGLSLVRRVVLQHGGTVEVDSPREGKEGSVFTVALPLFRKKQTGAPSSGNMASPPHGSAPPSPFLFFSGRP